MRAGGRINGAKRTDCRSLRGAVVGHEPPVEVAIQFRPRSMAGFRPANFRWHCLNPANCSNSANRIRTRAILRACRVLRRHMYGRKYIV